MYLTSTDLHLPVFRAFFAFFVTVGWRSVEVICKPFPKSENFSPVYGCRPTADQIITACRPLMGVWIEIDWVLAQCPLVACRPCVRGVDWKKVEVGEGRLHTFICERKNILFLLRVLSIYLTFTDLHFPVFRAFLPFFGGSRWRSVEVICKPFPKSEKFSPVYSPASHSQFLPSDCWPNNHRVSPTGRGWNRKIWHSKTVVYKPYIERNFLLFFSPA